MFGSAAAYFGLKTLPGAQNIASPKNLRSAEIGLRYTNTTASQGGVDHEKGIAGRIVASTDEALGDFYPKLYGGVDVGTALPWHNSSVWLYGQAGIAGGKHLSPLQQAAYHARATLILDSRGVPAHQLSFINTGFEYEGFGVFYRVSYGSSPEVQTFKPQHSRLTDRPR